MRTFLHVKERSNSKPLGAGWWRAFAWAIALLLLSGALSLYVSGMIAVRYPDRPMPRDLLFELMPYVDPLQDVTDVAAYSAIGLLLVYAIRKERRRIPEMLAMFGLMYSLRAVTMGLTPLASAHGNGFLYGLIHVVQNGSFPSGHAGVTLLCVLLVDREISPCLRKVMFLLAAIESLSLLMSHGHYSIDIIGGWLLSYFVYNEYTHGTLFGALKRLTTAPPDCVSS